MAIFFFKGPLAHLAPSEGYIEPKERVSRATWGATDYAEVKLNIVTSCYIKGREMK